MLDLKKATESNFTNSQFLELVEYSLSLDLQTEIHHHVMQNPNHFQLLGLEHPTVITLGRRAHAEESQILTDIRLPVVQTGRGGLATLHSPGQLVIYPILHLQAQNLSVKEYVRLLLETTKKVLAEFGIYSELSLDNAGLYTSKGKIAFCGVEIKNRITKHGISINVSNDLELFKNIIPCGYSNQKLDRIIDHGVSIQLRDLFRQWSSLFQEKLTT